MARSTAVATQPEPLPVASEVVADVTIPREARNYFTDKRALEGPIKKAFRDAPNRTIKVTITVE